MRISYSIEFRDVKFPNKKTMSCSAWVMVYIDGRLKQEVELQDFTGSSAIVLSEGDSFRAANVFNTITAEE